MTMNQRVGSSEELSDLLQNAGASMYRGYHSFSDRNEFQPSLGFGDSQSLSFSQAYGLGFPGGWMLPYDLRKGVSESAPVQQTQFEHWFRKDYLNEQLSVARSFPLDHHKGVFGETNLVEFASAQQTESEPWFREYYPHERLSNRLARFTLPLDHRKGVFGETNSAESAPETNSAESAPVQQSQSEPLSILDDDDLDDLYEKLSNRLAQLKSPLDHRKGVFIGETNSAESATVRQSQSEPLFMDDDLNEQLLNRRTRLKSPRDQQKGFFQETDSAESAPVQQSQSEPLFMDDDRNEQLLNRLARLNSPLDHPKGVFGKTNSAESAPVQQTQSESQFMNDWTPLFANIAGVSQAEGYSERDMHQTEVNNDNSTENDFNNNYTGATRYNGAHNDTDSKLLCFN
ncbi:hypothetical protein EV360DRAFT_82756 [Lentinula raphanica]|nr:hypothetical protein EV360DRAFT_82756 [Lentinula raphanica]